MRESLFCNTEMPIRPFILSAPFLIQVLRSDGALNGSSGIMQYYRERTSLMRNEWMVDRSSLVIAVYNGESGGTKNTIECAKAHGIEVVMIQAQRRNGICP